MKITIKHNRFGNSYLSTTIKRTEYKGVDLKQLWNSIILDLYCSGSTELFDTIENYIDDEVLPCGCCTERVILQSIPEKVRLKTIGLICKEFKL